MSNNVIVKDNLSVFDGRLNAIRPAILLLQVLSYLRDRKTNTVKLSRQELLTVLTEENKAPCDRVVRYWRRRLEHNGAIKYHASTYMINPLYVFDGAQSDYISCVEAWNKFPADYEPKFNSYIAV